MTLSKFVVYVSLAPLCGLLNACAVSHGVDLATVRRVDLQQFMGRWYVIACIPTRIEKRAFDATETYELRSDGRIDTTFTFREGSHDGPQRTYHPRGTVLDGSNARWGMQFIWPFKADYRIVYLNDGYSQVIVARQARDYVWIMARDSAIPQDQYGKLVRLVGGLGYDLNLLRLVPQTGR